MLAKDSVFNFQTPEDYLNWDDHTLWVEMLHNPQTKDMIEKIQRRDLLKMAYESRFDVDLKPNFSVQNLIKELSDASGIPECEIFVDLPSSPNVPYAHGEEVKSNQIYTFERLADGEIQRVDLENYSGFFEQFKGELKLLRVYTWGKNRSILKKIATKILGPPTWIFTKKEIESTIE